MFPNSNEFVGYVIQDKAQRRMLEKRFEINSNQEFITFSEWCEKSPLSSNFVASLIYLFIEPSKKDISNFYEVKIGEIVNYIKKSHDFYNRYYLFQFEQLVLQTSRNCVSNNSIFQINALIQKFVKLFREHIIWEESQPVPYIEFLNLQKDKGIYSIEECYAIIAKNRLKEAANHDEEQHIILQNIIQKINKYISRNRYDLQFHYYYKLFNQFQKDLDIHEFIEDKVLFPKAIELENNLLQLIDCRSVLN